MVRDLATATDALLKRVIEATQQREASRRRASKGALPNFAVGDFVLAATMRQAGKASKLLSTGSGPVRKPRAICTTPGQSTYKRFSCLDYWSPTG